MGNGVEGGEDKGTQYSMEERRVRKCSERGSERRVEKRLQQKEVGSGKMRRRKELS